MPNWCENQLRVIASDSEALEQFINDIKSKESPFAIQRVFPCPEAYYEDSRWYDWCINNWGTKWDVDSATLVGKDDKEAVYYFCSAWSPPEEAIRHIAKLYPELYFELKYAEGGMDYSGFLIVKNDTSYANNFGYEMFATKDDNGYYTIEDLDDILIPDKPEKVLKEEL